MNEPLSLIDFGSLKNVKKIAIMVMMALTSVSAVTAGTTDVSAIVKGKPVEFDSNIRVQVVQKSVDLLASCAYMNAKPNWGAYAEPQSIADAQKHSHLHLVFSSPRKIEVPVEKVTLQAREMVIGLPLATAGIWVRTDDGILYFAMFDPIAAGHLENLLDEAVKSTKRPRRNEP